MQIRTFIISLLAVCIFVGCGGPPRPAGMPPLFPCEITITQEGQPLENAFVQLVPEDGSSGWSIAGHTNANGVARILTHAQFPGAPEGTFKVLVSKTEHTLSSLPPEPADVHSREWEQWYELAQNERLPKFAIVQPKYDDIRATPHSITITQGRNQATFDVGEPVRIEIR